MPRLLRRFLADRAAVSAVEFALLLPIMLTLYIGGIQISDALSIDRKVTHVSSTLGDLVAQAKSIDDNEMSNILDAASAVVAPYSADSLQIKVSGIDIDKDGKATVKWSDARHDTPLAVGSSVTLPEGIGTASSFLVAAEVHYPYEPEIGYAITGTFDLNDKFYLRPRLSNDVKRPPTYK
jgi:Flp pilus assembly protein TadG